MQTLQILAITDETTTCECCGRSDLKKTVVLGHEGQEFGRFGTECAARALGWDAARVRRESRQVEDAARAEAARVRAAAAAARFQTWGDFCEGFGGIAAAIEHFGGFTAARQAFAA